MGLTCLSAAFFMGGAGPVNASFMTFDFFFNGKGQSGSGILEATENKDGSFTAVSGFVARLAMTAPPRYGNSSKSIISGWLKLLRSWRRVHLKT